MPLPPRAPPPPRALSGKRQHYPQQHHHQRLWQCRLMRPTEQKAEARAWQQPRTRAPPAASTADFVDFGSGTLTCSIPSHQLLQSALDCTLSLTASWLSDPLYLQMRFCRIMAHDATKPRACRRCKRSSAEASRTAVALTVPAAVGVGVVAAEPASMKQPQSAPTTTFMHNPGTNGTKPGRRTGGLGWRIRAALDTLIPATCMSARLLHPV